MTLRNRLINAAASNIYGFAISLIIQVGTVPVLLASWGATLFGEWLIVSSIPSYLVLSDFGLGTALSNSMVFNVARGDRRAALEAFQSVGVAIVAIWSVLSGVVVIAVMFLHPDDVFGLRVLRGNSFTVISSIFLLYVGLSQIQSLFQAGFRSDGHYAYGTALSNTLRFAEFTALGVTARFGGSPVEAAIFMVFVRSLGTIIIYVLLRFSVRWLRVGWSHARIDMLRTMFGPALSFLAFPIANALNLQSPLIIIGVVLGPEAAASFSTTRTLTRAAQQIMSIVNASVWPEMSRAHGENNRALLRELYRNSIRASVWLGICVIIFIYIAGPAIYRVWTGRVMELDLYLLSLLLVTMFFNMIWYTSSVVLAATNKHNVLAVACLLVNIALPCMCYFFLRGFGLNGAAFALAIAELVLAVIVVRNSVEFVGDSYGALLRITLNFRGVFALLRIWGTKILTR